MTYSTPHPYAAFAARRQRLIETLTARGGGVAIIPTAHEQIRNRDTHYPFRTDSYFYYLTGFTEPEAVLVLLCAHGGEPAQSILFCREKNEEREIWDGYRYGPQGAQETFGLDASFAVEELTAKLPELMADQPSLFYSLGHDAVWDERITQALQHVRTMTRQGKTAPQNVGDVRMLLDEMRLIKDATELSVMRQAAAISREAHHRAMRFTKPGQFEYEVDAEIGHTFRRHGSQAPAYPSIVAGGKNACVLHYVENNAVLQDGDLLLIDAGCELDGYASDITRTFPVNGQFSPAQKAVYDVVLAAQEAAIQAVKPGASWNAPHEAAVNVLTQGLIDLGLIEGPLTEAVQEERYRPFYMHRTGHWLGLDVHDAGEYKLNGDWRPLLPGMVLTVEPGLYIRPSADVAERYWNIGIRIEDDVLVTESGCEILTAGTAKTVEEIEALMQEKSRTC